MVLINSRVHHTLKMWDRLIEFLNRDNINYYILLHNLTIISKSWRFIRDRRYKFIFLISIVEI